jgi:hypothetical protein
MWILPTSAPTGTIAAAMRSRNDNYNGFCLFFRPDNDQLEVIIRGMKSLDNVDFTHIGPDWDSHDEEQNDGGFSSFLGIIIIMVSAPF